MSSLRVTMKPPPAMATVTGAPWQTTERPPGDTSIPVWPGQGAYTPDTDLYYACMDGAGDWLPDMAYGRLPARTGAVAAAVALTLLPLPQRCAR